MTIAKPAPKAFTCLTRSKTVTTSKILRQRKNINYFPKRRMNFKPIKLCPTKLFQIPFTHEHAKRYKSISNYDVGDCVLRTLTGLGVMHYSMSNQHSRNMYEKRLYTGDHGVYDDDTSQYLSKAFGTKIIHDYKRPSLKNGYGTIVGADFIEHNGKKNGHCFIMYKQNNIIYYFDPTFEKITSSINDIYKICETNKLDFVSYYNIKRKDAVLKHNKHVCINY
jgi:hypothetical protein